MVHNGHRWSILSQGHNVIISGAAIHLNQSDSIGGTRSYCIRISHYITPTNNQDKNFQEYNPLKMNESAHHIAHEDDDDSPIIEMFNGRSVFITGASGFIGRVLLEKLLRTYPGIKTIYILMRSKRDMSPQERLNNQLLKAPIFDNIRSMDETLLDKIRVIEGDIGYENLGISATDLRMLLEDETLSIVYHSAATVKFDEPLKTPIQFNLIATKSMIELCKQMKNLVAFCHVSTAYVNSDIKDNSLIEEKIYPMKQSPNNVIRMSQVMDDDLIQRIRPILLGERPNTYTFTKALAESLIIEEASELPVAIVRPSIVVAAWKEPIPGWVDNLNGPTGLIVATGKGLLRSMYGSRDVKADIIPVDICVNIMIAASYYTAREHNKLKVTSQPAQVPSSKTLNKKDPTIFHCTSGDTNPLTWGNFVQLLFSTTREYPSQQVLRYPFGSIKSNKYHDSITRLFVHYLPALFIDFLCLLIGKKRRLYSIYRRLHRAIRVLEHFTNTNYNFRSKNIHLLEQCLVHPRDRADLQLSIRDLNWNEFWRSYALGARRFILKEPDESLESSRISLRRALYVEIILRAVLAIVLSLVCLVVVTKITPIREGFNRLLMTTS